MLKALLRRIIGLGVTPGVLLARIELLRSLGLLSLPEKKMPVSIEQIFFSFPYHSVGDLILSLVLLDRVHERWPGASVDVAVGAAMAPLVSAIPYVRQVFHLPRSKSRYSAIAAYGELVNATRLFQKEISGIAYDLAIAPRWDSADSVFSAHLAALTGAPIRCGYSGSSDGGSAEVDRFLTVAAIGGAHEHESLRYMRLLDRCGLDPEVIVDPSASQLPIRALRCVAEERKFRGLAILSPFPGKYAVLSPGATSQRRVWPIDRFAEVGRSLFNRHQLRTIVIGGPEDIPDCAQLVYLIGAHALSMAGKTDSLQMLDLLAGAELFLGNDSGPAHIAGGLGVRTVVVSPFPLSCTLDHPNSPQRFRPVGPRVQILQPNIPLPPCVQMCLQDRQHCILQVASSQAIEAIDSVV